MARHRNIFLTGAPLALILALGAAACSEAEMEQAGAELGEAAADVAEATEEMVQNAGEATEEFVQNAGEAADAAVDSFRSAASDDARVYFVNLEDGDVVTSPVTIEFGSENIGVVPAGDQTPDTGHHHLLIDASLDNLDLEMPIPNDANHLHFGMAQTEATVELAPGQHTLQLVMGDWTHIPHDPVVASEVITITVE